ncbi:MAG: hypothetical protein A2W23_01435 [Planctomycetes bacterium RBG_16_43_13]|nr:MAG: hypothetical protein A2W23_01435 [Planctomycetes bacterium RBG_16_43_13]
MRVTSCGLRVRNYCLSGFTLIEIVLVVAIISMILLLAGTNIDYLIPEYALRGVAREMGALMKMAKTEAAVSGRDVYIEYDLSKGEYWLLVAFEKKDENAPTDVPDANEKPFTPQYQYERLFKKQLPTSVFFVDVIFGEGQRIDKGVATVRVSPFGFANHHIVNLKNTDDKIMAVKINGLTGGLTFYDRYKEADVRLSDY